MLLETSRWCRRWRGRETHQPGGSTKEQEGSGSPQGLERFRASTEAHPRASKPQRGFMTEPRVSAKRAPLGHELPSSSNWVVYSETGEPAGSRSMTRRRQPIRKGVRLGSAAKAFLVASLFLLAIAAICALGFLPFRGSCVAYGFDSTSIPLWLERNLGCQSRTLGLISCCCCHRSTPSLHWFQLTVVLLRFSRSQSGSDHRSPARSDYRHRYSNSIRRPGKASRG